MSDVFGPIVPPSALLPELALSRAGHDRMAHARSQPDLVEQVLATPGNQVLLVRDGTVPVVTAADAVILQLVPTPLLAVPAEATGRVAVLLGAMADVMIVALSVAPGDVMSAVTGEQTRWAGLREVGSLLSADHVGLAVEAVALDHWHRTHQHCPRCGAATVPTAAGHQRRCPVDASLHHPRSDPAVIMLVLDPADRVLLGRQATWPLGRHSVLAGFVEPGESLEAAVARETYEEVGVVVDDVRYLGSQPWPFPASLMLAFEARAVTTDIAVDGVEIVEADWYSREDLARVVADATVLLPPRLSIARQMLQRWAGSALGDDTPWR